MKMTALQLLHRSMWAIDSEMQQFQVRIGAISFDCLFSTRDTPNYTLALTSRGLNPKFFLFQVQQGYWIAPYFGDMYGELVNLLSTGANTGNKLIPKDFLNDLNNGIPVNASLQQNPTPNEVVRLRPDIIEDRDRPYFDTWIYWTQTSGKGPTADNLYKTRMLLGNNALVYSQHMNASSRWSATDLSRNWEDEK